MNAMKLPVIRARKYTSKTNVAMDYLARQKIKEAAAPPALDNRNYADENQLEYDLTCQVAEYLDILVMQKKVVCYSHIPQETYTKSWVTKGKNKKMGVHSGVPDMLIIYPHAVLFLELKRRKGGKVSDSQKKWIEAINAIWDEHVYAAVACGWDAAKKEIDSYFIK